MALNYAASYNARLADEDRYILRTAGKPEFATLTPAQQATELVARMEIAKQHRDREGFETAKAGLVALIERL